MRKQMFIHLQPLSTHFVGLEKLPVHPVPAMNTCGIAFRRSIHDPEVVSPMIPACARPIGLFSTKRTYMSNPSPILPIAFPPSIDPVVPLPSANGLGKLGMGPVR